MVWIPTNTSGCSVFFWRQLLLFHCYEFKTAVRPVGKRTALGLSAGAAQEHRMQGSVLRWFCWLGCISMLDLKERPVNICEKLGRRWLRTCAFQGLQRNWEPS